MLEEGGTGQKECVDTEACHGQLDLDATALIQEMGKDDAEFGKNRHALLAMHQWNREAIEA